MLARSMDQEFNGNNNNNNTSYHHQPRILPAPSKEPFESTDSRERKHTIGNQDDSADESRERSPVPDIKQEPAEVSKLPRSLGSLSPGSRVRPDSKRRLVPTFRETQAMRASSIHGPSNVEPPTRKGTLKTVTK